MLTPILATDDPYVAAASFVEAGWSLVFQTPPDSGDPLTGVGRAAAHVRLGTSAPKFLASQSRAHKGAGVEFHVTVPPTELDAIYAAQAGPAESVTELRVQPWGDARSTP